MDRRRERTAKQNKNLVLLNTTPHTTKKLAGAGLAAALLRGCFVWRGTRELLGARAPEASGIAPKSSRVPLHLPSQDHGTAFVQLQHGRVVSVGPVFEGRGRPCRGSSPPAARTQSVPLPSKTPKSALPQPGGAGPHGESVTFCRSL